MARPTKAFVSRDDVLQLWACSLSACVVPHPSPSAPSVTKRIPPFPIDQSSSRSKRPQCRFHKTADSRAVPSTKLCTVPRINKSTREAARLRQSKFRERTRSSGLVEVRALLPKSIVADMELAALFLPAGTKDLLVRTALESHLEKNGRDVKQMTQVIAKFWGPIMEYKAYSPALLRTGQSVRIKDRIYSYEESLKLAEIRATILAFFRARGVRSPEHAAFAVYKLATGRK